MWGERATEVEKTLVFKKIIVFLHICNIYDYIKDIRCTSIKMMKKITSYTNERTGPKILLIHI